MIIIADSGSTKCTWLFHDGGKTTSVRTRGINALQHTPEQIRETLAALPPCGPVSAVHIYSAGCSPAFPVSNEKLRRELEARFGAARIEVRSDLLGAARALFGRDEGIASARAPTRATAATARWSTTYRRWATCWATRGRVRCWAATS